MANNLSQFEKDDTKAIVLRLINNLSMNIQNQKILQILIQPLIEIYLDKKHSKVIKLATIQCLTNLSTLNEYHYYFVEDTSQLLDRFDEEQDSSLKKGNLSVLVNLSSNNKYCHNFIHLPLPDCHNFITSEDYPDSTVQKKYFSFVNNILRNVERNLMEHCEEGTIGYCLLNN
ncbi:DgyrCDS3735 [Dimorphilus gyrociliatus]|uniref:DgyrCDS3735 n=1 Tax=Dimorphilus gyrociliatus TaxID=2664684 RepID=A0A7I8VH04_9ANNE|nr:DgyrCDS3735 [Dimorphilus gyrociliatus]